MLAFWNQKKSNRLDVFAFKIRLDKWSIREHLVGIPEPCSLQKWVENLSPVVEGAFSLSRVLVDHYWSYLLPTGLYWTMSTDQTSGHKVVGTCTGFGILISKPTLVKIYKLIKQIVYHHLTIKCGSWGATNLMHCLYRYMK